jgi:uncharacterized protein involved in cysteine biosynthesis
MFTGFFKAFDQIPDPAFRRVMGRALLWGIGLFSVLLIFTWWLIVSTRMFGIDWLEWVADVIGWLAAPAVAFLLFPGAMLVVISFMLDDIARAVEARHYPDLPEPRSQPLREAVLASIRFALLTITVNLIFLPLYFIPVVNVFVFGAVNGYLLGREYFELVAMRRLDAETTRALWRRYRGRLFVAGVVITFLLSIPVVNWFMPVVATAFMLHIFESLRRKQSA